jgi:peptidyl-prolyl cis-trans isomerase B (cyclophilin B)
MIKLWMISACMLIAINLCYAETEGNSTVKKEDVSKENPVIVLKTNMGSIKIELFRDKAPATVENFLAYVHSNHYDNTIFHRIIPGFMVQGGGFTVDFKQKPTNAPVKNEADNGLKNTIGSVAMARTSDPDSATAQFFINLEDNDFLNFKSKSPTGWGYTVFGKVIDGMPTVEKIAKVKTGNYGQHRDVPLEPAIILSAKESPSTTETPKTNP